MIGVLLICIGVSAAAAADAYLALKARFYDHDYGDFGNEFSATSVDGCADAIYDVTKGMVRDSLAFDPALGKKIPLPGAKDYCSSQMRKWFDPAFSRSAACGNLFFRNVGDSARPVWKFEDTAFFPVDSISPQRRVVLADGKTVDHDFAYCMEINAALDYRGGETLKARGDDDAWIFLDGRLAVDQGGIHYAREETVALDTLPFLKGKLGRIIDLDVYFCSRQPGTSVFGMEAAARLKPLSLKSLQISDSAGRPLSSQDVLIGKSRVCARANYQNPGEEQCGNYQPPPDLSFLSANWDLNGKTVSLDGGQACLDLDPASFPERTRITLTARASGLISRIGVTLVRPARPLEGVLAGSGRAERVEVRLDPLGGSAPDGLEAAFDFAGTARWAWLRPDPARPWILAGSLAGGNAGPPGLTGFAPVMAATKEFIFGKSDSSAVALRDGVGPILLEASLHWDAEAEYPARLELRASETLSGTGDSLGRGLLWKRAAGAWLGPLWPTAVRAGGDSLTLGLAAAEGHALKPGDSVSLGPEIRDGQGNAGGIRFVPILFPRNLDLAEIGVRVRPDPARGRFFVPRNGEGILIPVDAAGRPLSASGADAALAEAGGPILEIPMVVPPARIRLLFHDNLGTFVNEADRVFGESEWAAMRAASPGDTTVVRLLWHPVAHAGNRLATGAYVVHGRLWTRPALVRGRAGESAEVNAASLAIPPLLFGYIRD